MKTLVRPEFESALLGAVLLDNSVFDRLRADLFTSAFHRSVFGAVGQILGQGGTANLQTVSAIVGAENVAKVAQLTDTPAVNIPYYVAQLAELERRRRLYHLAQIVAEDVAETNSGELVEKIEGELLAMHEGRTSGTFRITDLLKPTVESIEADVGRKGKIGGLPSGFDTFDSMTDGFHPGELIIIGARPGSGKTSLALNMTTAIVLAGKGVLFFSAEMSRDMIMRRLISQIGRIDAGRLRRGLLAESDFPRITEAAGELYGKRLFLNDTPNISLSDLRSEARRARKTEKIDAVIVDYLGLIEHGRKDLPRYEQISEISRSLKGLARELEIPVIALAQLNRLAANNRPNLAHLRDSGSIEQDADLVCLLWVKGRLQDDPGKVEVSLLVEKNRHGGTGEIPMIFHAAFTRFTEAA